jgi:hypothetical protein
MGRECAGSRMMFAGLIVLLVGLAVALAATLRIPGYWTPALVGAVLFLVGALRWAIRGDRPSADTDRR